VEHGQALPGKVDARASGSARLWQRLKREAPRYAKMLPELPRLVHQNLEHSNADLRRDLAAMLAEQRQTNRLLSSMSGWAWALSWAC